MLPECPEDLRYLLPYLQRGSELRGRDPVVAYYCGFYAANLAMTKGYPKSPVNDAFLSALLDELNSEKEQIKSHPAIQDSSVGRAHILQFALKIFLTADNEDRSGQATKKTARLFLISSQFLETLYQFGVELGPELEDRIRYAKWKASDIVRALNEGRVPQAGAPIPTTTNTSTIHMENSVKEEEPDSPSTVMNNLPSMSGSYGPSFVNTPPASTPIVPQSPPTQPKYTPPPPAAIVSPPPVLPTPSVRSGSTTSSSSSPPFLTFDQAEKHCRYAVSAIQFEDAPTAIKEMETAIKILKSIQP